ncbi:MAG: asparagine synthase (glutamine-hydrolyzing) [Candidatus Eisenbacteria bacterium]|nr:asparagine synthase (glutamine-hydrolyzing) [Candidatus Eisenbacteria bacterium]
MCGIVGWYARGGRQIEPGVPRAMCATIVHRGPDDEGTLAEGDFSFGMRRLAIVDLSPAGHQPMESDDGRYVITFNGEVFNHPALKAELEALGHTFRGHSDTESILRGFATWGPAVWAKLEGMFAVALWDRHEKTLHLSRDPLGIKPYFYTLQNGGIAWASELKALAAVPGLSFTPRAKSMDEYFAFGHVLAPHTIYDEVLKLPPGCSLTVSREGEPRLERFWRFEYKTSPERSERDWIERFREEFLACTRRHLQADVPLGAFLSGGVDSSAVVAAMSQVMDEPVRTFTIGFDVNEFDESPFARRVAEHLGCVHTERKVQLDDAAVILPQLARCYDEPFADPSAIPTWYVSRLAREQVIVAMSGDGGDELFAGYERHYNERLVQENGPLFRWAAALAQLPPLPLPRWNYFRQRLAKVSADAALPSTYQRFFSKYQLAPRAVRANLYRPEFAAQLDPGDELARLEDTYFSGPAVSRDPVERLLYADTMVRLPDDMLTKVDRASMAHSLEVRVPFLAHTFVDFAASVPVSMKLRGSTGKYILRKAVEPWLPPGILDRPKQGFAVPLARWVRGDFGRYAEELWRDSGADGAGALRPEAVSALFAEHRGGTADRSQMLFALAMFALWWADRPRSR